MIHIQPTLIYKKITESKGIQFGQKIAITINPKNTFWHTSNRNIEASISYNFSEIQNKNLNKNFHRVFFLKRNTNQIPFFKLKKE